MNTSPWPGGGPRPRLLLDRCFDLGRGVTCPERGGDGPVDPPEPPRPVPSTAKGGGFGQDRFQAPPREGWGGTHPLFYRALHPRAGKSTNTGTRSPAREPRTFHAHGCTDAGGITSKSAGAPGAGGSAQSRAQSSVVLVHRWVGQVSDENRDELTSTCGDLLA